MMDEYLAGHAASLMISYLNLQDVEALRLTCRCWRSWVDHAMSHVHPYSMAAFPSRWLHVASLTYRQAVDSSNFIFNPHAVIGGGFLRIAVRFPGLTSVDVQCDTKGCTDFHQLALLPCLCKARLSGFPMSDVGAIDSLSRGCCGLRQLTLQSGHQAMALRHLQLLAALSCLESLVLLPREFSSSRPEDAAGVVALTQLRGLTQLVMRPSGAQPAHHDLAWLGTAASASALAASALGSASSRQLGVVLLQLPRLQHLHLSGMAAIPQALCHLTQLRSICLDNLGALDPPGVACLLPLAALTGLTLTLGAPQPPPPAAAPRTAPCRRLLAALTALTGLRELVLGSGAASGAAAGGGGGAGAGRDGTPVTAHLCLTSLEQLDDVQALRHVCVDAHGWHSACLTVKFPSARTAAAALHHVACHQRTGAAGHRRPSWLRAADGAAPAPPPPVTPLAPTHHSGGMVDAELDPTSGAAVRAGVFANHPCGGAFVAAWPRGLLMLTMQPCLGHTPTTQQRLLTSIIRAAQPGAPGLGFAGSMADSTTRRLLLSQHRSCVPPALLMSRLAAARQLRRLQLTLDQHWPPAVLGHISCLAALPQLSVLSVDCGRVEAPDLFWTGVASLTALTWLCLRWFSCVPLAQLQPLTGLRALQLRDVGRAPGAAELADAAAHMPRLRYLALEGLLLDVGEDLLAALADLAADGRFSAAWIEHALCSRPGLRLLGSVTLALVLGALLHAPRWPEMFVTAVLAAVAAGALVAAVAVSLAALLMGWPAGAGGPGPRQPGAALRQLRYLSLRRCTLSRRGSGGGGGGACARRAGAALLRLLRSMRDLRYLDVMWLNVGPEELAAAAALTQLHYMCVAKTQLQGLRGRQGCGRASGGGGGGGGGDAVAAALSRATATVYECQEGMECVLEAELWEPAVGGS